LVFISFAKVSQGLKSSMEKVERKPRPTRFLHDPAWVYLSPFQKISCPWAWPTKRLENEWARQPFLSLISFPKEKRNERKD